MVKEKKVRVLIAKIGLDGHDRVAKVVASALRDAGMEVIYSGLHNTPESIAEVALQEDVDVIGVSILSGAHLTLVPALIKSLREKGVGDVSVIVGGIIPYEDEDELLKIGVKKIFRPGTPLSEIIDYIKKLQP
jgi:methylmalonyl-CoA mutase C-terminal domain/subunit